MEKEYPIKISPEILELLGPSLYTNIYYVLAELVANSYDADAENVWVTMSDSSITIVNLCTFSISEGEVLKLSILIFRRVKIPATLPKIPIEFSVYNVIVYSCFESINLYFNLISETLVPCSTIGNTLFSLPTTTSKR